MSALGRRALLRWPQLPSTLAVDWSNPLTDRLAHAFLFREVTSGLAPVVDLCGGLPLVGVSATATSSREDIMGPVGRAANASGSSGWGTVSPNDDYTPGTGAGQGMTVVMGALLETAGVANQFAHKYNSPAFEWAWGILAADGLVYAFQLDNTAGGFSGRKSPAPSAGIWHDLAYAWDGTTPPKDSTQLWTDGLRVDTTDYTGGTFTQTRVTAQTLRVGGQNSGLGATTAARYAYAYFFRRGLLPDELGTLADNPLALLRETRRARLRLRPGVLTSHLTLTLTTDPVGEVYTLRPEALLQLLLTTDDVAILLSAHRPLTTLAFTTESVDILMSVHLASHTTLAFTTESVEMLLSVHLASHTTLAFTTDDVSIVIQGSPLHVSLVLTTDDVVPALALRVFGTRLAFTTDDVSILIALNAMRHLTLRLTTEDTGVLLLTHIDPLGGTPAWKAASRHPSGAYSPVGLVDFLSYTRTFSTRAIAVIATAELDVAQLQAGGIGALTQTLDEVTDEVRIGNVSVALVNPHLLSRTFMAAILLNTPVRLRLGFVDLPEADYLPIFTGLVDRYEVTYPALTMALIDTSLQQRTNLMFPLDTTLFSGLPTENVGTLVPLVIGVHVDMPTIRVGPGEFLTGIGVERLNAVRRNGLVVNPSTVLRAVVPIGAYYALLISFLLPEPETNSITVDVNASTPSVVFTPPTPLMPPVDGSNRLSNGGFETGDTTGWTTADGGVLTVSRGGLAGASLLVNGDFASGDATGWTPASGGSVLVGTGAGVEALTNGGFETGDTTGWTGAGSSENLVRNGSFEAGLSPWSVTTVTNGGFAIEQAHAGTVPRDGATGQPSEGIYCGVARVVPGSPFYTLYDVTIYQDIPTIIGRTYTLSFAYISSVGTYYIAAVSTTLNVNSDVTYSLGVPGNPTSIRGLTTAPRTITYGVGMGSIIAGPNLAQAVPLFTPLTVASFVATGTTTRITFVLSGTAEAYVASPYRVNPPPLCAQLDAIRVGEGSYGGDASLIVVGTANPGPYAGTYRLGLQGGHSTALGLTQDVTVLQGHPYTVTAYMLNTDGVTGADVTITSLGLGSTTQPDVYGVFTTSNTGAWLLATFVGVPLFDTVVRLRVGSEYASVPHSSYVDAVSLMRFASTVGVPQLGTYRAELAGGDEVYGDLYQDITVTADLAHIFSGSVYNPELFTPAIASRAMVLLGTPADPDAYATLGPYTLTNSWLQIPETMFTPTGTTVRVTLQSQYTSAQGGILPSLFTGLVLEPATAAVLIAPPYEGQYRAELRGALDSDGRAMIQCATLTGTTYTYEVALWAVRNLEDPADESIVSLLVGTTTDPDAYATVAQTAVNGWQQHIGSFVANESVTRLTVTARYTDTPYSVYLDAFNLHVTPADTQLLTPTLNHLEGENPVDAIVWVLATFDPTARFHIASFAAARLACEGLLLVGRITAPTDSLTLASRMARQSGLLLQKTRHGEYLLTVLDNTRPTAFVFDVYNVTQDVVVSSTPSDALYTSFYVYFDTGQGGSTAIADYAAVAFLTAEDTNAVGGDIAGLQALCATARANVGRERRLEFFADLVRDPATAYHLLAFLVARYATVYATVQWRTFLDALPLRLGDLTTMEHRLLPVAYGAAPVEILGVTVEPSTMTVALTGRTPSTLFTLEAPPPVSKYVQFFGSSSSQLLLPNLGFFNGAMTQARSLTLMVVASHITTGGTLFFLRQDLSGSTDRTAIVLGPDTLDLQMGSGASSYVANHSNTFGWSCQYSPESPQHNDPITAQFLAGSPIDQSQLGLYIVTLDWHNHAMYTSGAIPGYQAFVQANLSYAECTEINIFTEPSVSILQRDYYVGQNIGTVYDVGIGVGGFVGRLYEYLMVISAQEYSMAEIVATIHAPLLSYLSALYTPGVTVRDTVGLPLGNQQLWYRDQHTLSGLNPPSVEFWPTWQGVPSLATIRNPDDTVVLPGAPTQVAVSGALPLLLPGLTLAPIPDE